MPISSEAAHYRGKIAGIKRAIRNGERPANDPELTDAQTALATVMAAEHINRALTHAPPLTDEQRNHLAELLKPARASITKARLAELGDCDGAA